MSAKRILIFLSLGAGALLGFCVIIYLTSQRGIGLTIDGPIYIALARHFLNDSTKNVFLPYNLLYTCFPLFFPFFLSCCSRLSGLDPAETVRWLHATFMACNVLCIGFLLEKYTRSLLIAIAGLLLACFSLTSLSIYSSALSEPLFIFFTLLWLIFFMDFLEDSKQRTSFILCIVMLMCACITRWAGLTLTITSITGILMLKREEIKTRLVYMAILGGIGLLPMFIWSGINRLSVGIPIDRIFVFHPPALSGYNILDELFFVNIGDLPFFVKKYVVILMSIFLVLGWMIWEKRDKDIADRIPATVVNFIRVLFLFCFIYYVGLVLTMVFFDATTKPDHRMLFPLHIFWILLTCVLLHILLMANKKSKMMKALFIMLFICIGGTNGMGIIKWALQRHAKGEDYDGMAWQNSAIIAEVKKIPLGKVLYTNNSNALYVAAKREALNIVFVSKNDIVFPMSNSLRSSFMTSMRNDLRTYHGLLVYCDRLCESCKGFPSIDELREEFPLKVVQRVSDGAIYAWDEHRSIAGQ